MALPGGFNTSKELEAKRFNNKEANRLRLKKRLYEQEHQHSEHVANKNMRSLKESMNLLQSSTGSLSAFASYQDKRLPLFMYGQRLESRKYSKRISLLRFFHQQKRPLETDATIEFEHQEVALKVDERTADEIFDSILQKVDQEMEEMSERRSSGQNDQLDPLELREIATRRPKAPSAVTPSQGRSNSLKNRPKTAPSLSTKATGFTEFRKRVDSLLEEEVRPLSSTRRSGSPERGHSAGSRFTIMTEAERQRNASRTSSWSNKSRQTHSSRSLRTPTSANHRSPGSRFTQTEDPLLSVEAFIQDESNDPLLPYQPAKTNKWMQKRPSIFAPTFSSRQHSLISVMISSSKKKTPGTSTQK